MELVATPPLAPTKRGKAPRDQREYSNIKEALPEQCFLYI